MGPYVNRRSTTAVAGVCALVVTCLNLYLATSVIFG
ncbi:Mn2+/Fe2+ NRAMP family transporter [Kibdelosporangium phytohabitans]|nr:Mn2+/Fe2+ NRAMP family transporter [Kibdelosporangium phytohabitans]